MACHVWAAGALVFIIPFTQVAAEECGGKLWEQGTLRSPNYPGIYPENASCTWNIVASARKAVLLQIGSLSLELNKDKLRVYAGSRVRTSRLKFTYTGQYWYTGPIELGHEATVVFTSDHAVGMMGFSISFTSVVPSPPCGGSLFDQGYMRSPNYPGLYPNNVKCTWNIVASSGKVVLLQSSYINLEQINDKIAIYNGSRARAADLKVVYTGQTVTDALELGAQATVVFTSNQRVNMMGFHIYFTSIFRTRPCGGNLTGHGFFATPNYPYTYPNAAECTWNIQASPNKVLRFDIDSLNLETNEDFLMIYNGNRASVQPIVYTGQVLSTYIEAGPEVTAVFTSGYAVSWSGFNITFSSVVPAGLSTAATPSNAQESITPLTVLPQGSYTACGGNFTEQGFFATPNYPYAYPNAAECTWNIQASPNKVLRFDIDSLNLETNQDFLTIYNGDRASVQPIVYTGHVVSTYIEAGPEVTAVFTSGYAVSWSGGFNITFSSVVPTGLSTAGASSNAPEINEPLFIWPPGSYTDCGGNLTTEGNFTSPFFPDIYPDNTFCNWHLYASPGKVLLVNVVELSLEYGYDFLRIHSSGDPNNYVIYDYLYQGEVSNVTLNLGTEATATFTSDYSVQRSGFYVAFTSVSPVSS